MDKLVHFTVGFIGTWLLIVFIGGFVTWDLGVMYLGGWDEGARLLGLLVSIAAGVSTVGVSRDKNLNWKFKKK